MTNAEPDAYIVNVLGKTRKDLVSANMKADGTLDAAVNTPITQNNLEEETDRLSRLMAEVSNCKAVITDCTPLIADARTKLSGDNMNSDDVLNDLDTVKRRLIQAYKSRSMWPRVFIKLLVYNFLIAAGLVVLIFLKSLVPDSDSARSMAAGVLACAVWGMFRGDHRRVPGINRAFYRPGLRPPVPVMVFSASADGNIFRCCCLPDFPGRFGLCR
jgi:hypothetical protein